MLGNIFTIFNTIEGFQDLIDSFPADDHCLVHPVKIPRKLDQLTITPCMLKAKEAKRRNTKSSH